MKSFIMLSFFSAIVFTAFESMACYAEISDEDLVNQSDIIVIGKITAIKEGGKGIKDVSIATISVTEVLKGEKNTKEVKLAFPSRRRGVMASTDIFYDLNQEGIWLLRKDQKQDYYRADYPARFQPVENSDTIKEVISKTTKIEGSLLENWKKEVIDKWIADNNLNRYGDPKDSVYMGGTPLFDENSGEYINRYEYIYMRHPEVRKLILEKSKAIAGNEKKTEITDETKRKIDE